MKTACVRKDRSALPQASARSSPANTGSNPRERGAGDRAGQPDRRRLLRAFLKRTLEDDALADAVNELLFEHVVARRYHPSVVAESLPSYISEILGAATREDWQAVADELISEAREVDGEV